MQRLKAYPQWAPFKIVGQISLFNLIATPVWADIYVTVDPEGKSHFSDTPGPNSRPYQPQNTLQGIPKPALPAINLPTPKTSSAKPAGKQALQKAIAKQHKRCTSLDKRIRKLTNKLRKGHSNEQGNRWRKERRTLSDQRYKECR